MREIDLDDNPIKDSKIKKMMGKSYKFVKELLTTEENCKTGLAKKAGNAMKSSKKKKKEKEEEGRRRRRREGRGKGKEDAQEEEEEEQKGDVSETESESRAHVQNVQEGERKV